MDMTSKAGGKNLAEKNRNAFHKTYKLIEQLEEDHLKCVKCGDLLGRTIIYGLKKCDHKYCTECISHVKDSGMCLICDVRINEDDIGPDIFLTQLAQRVQRFKQAIEKFENKNKD